MQFSHFYSSQIAPIIVNILFQYWKTADVEKILDFVIKNNKILY
jgi:hypothetical protein